MLEITNVTKTFGGLAAVNQVSFSVNEGEVVGLIGPNGAGKTTLLNLICGIYKPDAGSIRFDGTDITGQPPNRVCKLGISRTYQIPQPFEAMTALAGVLVECLERKETSQHEPSPMPPWRPPIIWNLWGCSPNGIRWPVI